MDGYNQDITELQKQKLAELLPGVLSEGKVDWNKLKATLGEEVDLGERYGLSWKGKSGVFGKIQEKTTSTLHPQPEESVDWDATQNMFIEGDNLEALKVLHKAYYGKIKMIYIDPPYNTGNDFVYNDDFAKTKRQQALEEGAIDEEGNVTRDDGLRVNTGGHKHSNWLDMMYPRLFLARNLLRQDGVIFVSIDDNEVHNLRLMINEIFGEENFVANVIIHSNPRGRQSSDHVAESHESLLVYARSEPNLQINGEVLDEKQRAEYSKTDSDGRKYREIGLRLRGGRATAAESPTLHYPLFYNQNTGILSTENDGDKSTSTIIPEFSDGTAGTWRWSKQKVNNSSDDLVVRKVKSTNGERFDVFQKDYLTDTKTRKLKSLWLEKEINYDRSKDDLRPFGMDKFFDYAKPTTLLKKIVRAATSSDNDIILDFFSGSGTTAHAVDELNAEDGGSRKWIMVQLPELTDEKSEAYRAGYKTIAGIARERIRRAGAKISKDFADKIAEREEPLDLGFRSYSLGDSNFKKWNELVIDPEEIKQQVLDNLNPLEDGVKDEDLLTEILLKRGISPLAEINSHDDFVVVPSESLAVSLSRQMTQGLFNQMLAVKPSQIILLDVAFQNDVNLKTNLALQAKKQNITLEVL